MNNFFNPSEEALEIPLSVINPVTYLAGVTSKAKDPTTLNSQGPDFGTQYRSEIFYLNDNQKMIAEKVLNEVNARLSGKVVTRISLLKNYCPAEEYHQKYLEKR